MQGNKIDYDAPTGNLIDDLGKGFTQQVFAGSYVGEDVVSDLVGASNPILNTVSSLLGF